LDFDPNNPRFGGAAKGFSQDKIQELLEQNPHYAKELVPSLVENGFIAYEPLVVREKGTRFIVIEGNRRLAAVRHILSSAAEFSDEIRHKFAKIPVLVFPSAVTDESHRDAIRVYLGIHHLFGFREWPSESKAKFLDQNIATARDLQRLVKEMGFGRSQFERYLIPYRLRMHAEKSVGAVSVKDFWTFGESLNRTDVKEYLKLEIDSKTLQIKEYDQKKLKFLLGFLYGIGGIQRRISETRQIGILAKVLGSKKASEVLERGGSLEEAQLYVQSKQKTAGDLANKLENLLKRVYKLRPREPELGRILDLLQTYQRKLGGTRKNA
jgi:hypothetical protein